MTDKIAKAWDRIDSWLEENAPDLAGSLGPAVEPDQIAAAEKVVGTSFPDELKAHLARHNGSDENYVLGRWYLMDADYIAHEWKLNLEIGAGLEENEEEPFWKRSWLPVVSDGGGNFLALDMDDGSLVTADNDPYERVRAAASLADWLLQVADDMEAGKYEVREEGAAIFRPDDEE